MRALEKNIEFIKSKVTRDIHTFIELFTKLLSVYPEIAKNMYADATIENSLNCVEYEDKKIEESLNFTHLTNESSQDNNLSSSNDLETLPLLQLEKCDTTLSSDFYPSENRTRLVMM